jgi:peptidoglycan-associated lipoprotein
MKKLSFCIISVLIVCCFGFILTGCPKKATVSQDFVLSAQQAAEEAAAIEQERARRELEERERAKRESELARKEKELREQAEAARRAAEAEKELERSLVPKRYPGIEGEVFESSLLKDIYFEFDRYDVQPEAASLLKEDVALLIKYPKMKIQIEGHCDERGTNEYNLALGERRANSTMKHLVLLGISGDRISTISYGEERPFNPGHNEAAWAKNRRAHMVIVSR